MEYLLLIIEFLYVKGLKAIFWHFLFPIVIGLLVFYKGDPSIYREYASNFQNNLVTVLGILIGFTISAFTMLLTVNNSNVDRARARLLNKKIFSKQLTLFDSVLIGLAYIILIQGLLLIANFIYPVFISVESSLGKIMFSINVAFLIHVILTLIRNILDFYFILTKKDE
jgi:hypothetical protein